MMLSLSASQPTVSATGGVSVAVLAHGAHHLAVDALDEIVAALIERIDAALRGRDLVIVTRARLILLVPELDIGARELGDQRADRWFIGHEHRSQACAWARRREGLRSLPSPCLPSLWKRSRVPLDGVDSRRECAPRGRAFAGRSSWRAPERSSAAW